MPDELHRVGKWLEVGDGPLVAVGAAGAYEVAQQVQVEADEDQERRQPWMGRHASALDDRAEGEVGHRAGDDVGGEGADQRKRQCVQRMVILRKPQQGMRRVSGQKFGDDADAVEIRGDSGGHDQRFFTSRKRGGVAGREGGGQHPSCKEMRNGAHRVIGLIA